MQPGATAAAAAAAAAAAREAGPDATFQDLRRVMAVVRNRFHRGVQAHGLTFPQWFILKTVRREGRRTVKELADALEVTPANVTGIVDRLERDGLVARSRGTEDRRVVYVRLTERGHEKAQEMKGYGDAMLADLFAEWTPEDHRTMRALLAKVRLAPDDATDF